MSTEEIKVQLTEMYKLWEKRDVSETDCEVQSLDGPIRAHRKVLERHKYFQDLFSDSNSENLKLDRVEKVLVEAILACCYSHSYAVPTSYDRLHFHAQLFGVAKERALYPPKIAAVLAVKREYKIGSMKDGAMPTVLMPDIHLMLHANPVYDRSDDPLRRHCGSVLEQIRIRSILQNHRNEIPNRRLVYLPASDEELVMRMYLILLDNEVSKMTCPQCVDKHVFMPLGQIFPQFWNDPDRLKLVEDADSLEW